jgi:hypothetical protein
MTRALDWFSLVGSAVWIPLSLVYWGNAGIRTVLVALSVMSWCAYDLLVDRDARLNPPTPEEEAATRRRSRRGATRGRR